MYVVRISNPYERRCWHHRDTEGHSVRRLGIALLIVVSSLGHALCDESPSTGTVTGTIEYAGDSARPWRYQRYYVKGKTGPLTEAVVALEGEGLPALADDRKPVEHVMDQKDFRFVPETMTILRGDRVEFTNSDTQLHNVFSIDLAPFNVNTPAGGSHVQAFERAGNLAKPVRIGCIYHSNMKAWIYVLDHRFHALTPAAGTFRIDDVPPGRYDLTVVHPAGRLRRSMPVEVTAGHETKLELRLSPDDLIRKRTDAERESDSP